MLTSAPQPARGIDRIRILVQVNDSPSTSSPPVRQQQPTHPRRVLFVLLLPLFMALVAVSVINVALTPIGHSLKADTEGLQWVLSGYALAFAVLLVPAGRVGDATGRRRILLLGVGLFTLGSLIAGLSPNVGVLNISRIMQGLGSGLLNPQSIGLIQANFRGQARAKAFAMFGTTVAVATALGPVIGGLLIQVLGEDTGWRWIFFSNVPIGVLAIVLGFAWIPDDRRRSKDTKPDLDPVGTLLLAVAILLIMLPFLERSVSALVWLLLPLGLLLIFGWVSWENRYRDTGRPPMVDPDIFRSPPFRNGILIVSVYFLGATSIWIVLPLFLQMHLHRTPFEASIIGLPSSIGAMITSQLGGRYVLQLGRRLVITGFIVVLAGLALVAVMAGVVESGALPFWALAFPLTLVGVSQGMTISPNQTLTLGAVDPRYGGVAGGILSLGQRIGAAVGTALIPGILFSLTENGTPWLEAFIITLTVIMLMAMAALGVSVVDRKRERLAGTEG
ncbi:MFS transporter [Brachybacterium endophyticum]|uniref:MFS transporter n=1 Tax=Brachybacterium endophyticum TaxID=2182385 RepID=A0A2U2RJT3_9MICO|nr:MFS transporter [Brachybacterium endophyticum]